MACAGNPAITNYNSDNIYTKPQYSQNLKQYDKKYTESPCRKITSMYPSFTPTINNLSITSSKKGIYTIVYINGTNFLPPVYGTTFLNFGNEYKNIPILFYTTSQISFVIPLNATIGNYNVVVVNVYNCNFSPQINSSNTGNLNYSNSITYTIF
jgi:hypothetical protein